MDNQKFTLDIKDDNNNELHTALGISQDRATVLADFAIDLIEKSKPKMYIPTALTEVVAKAETFNELIFLVYGFAAAFHSQHNNAKYVEVHASQLPDELIPVIQAILKAKTEKTRNTMIVTQTKGEA